jgi:phage terminase small subunit
MPNPTTSKRTKIAAIQRNTAPKKVAPLPSLPKSLPAAYRTEWRALVQHMRDTDIWVPQKSGLAESYLINLWAVREAQSVMTAGGGIMADGKPHPAGPVIVRHTATLNKLAEQLGLGKGKVAQTTPTKPATSASNTWSA